MVSSTHSVYSDAETHVFIQPALNQEVCSVACKVNGCAIVPACWTSFQPS